MPIDYTRRPPSRPDPEPAGQSSGGGLPSWYTPPDEMEAAAPAPPVQPAAPVQPAPPVQPAAPTAPVFQPTASFAGQAGSGGVSLHKVTLTSSAPRLSLTKSGGATGTIRVNLNWSTGKSGATAGGGFFKRMAAAAAKGVDLDLCCLYELSDGRKGVIQALGNSFGALDRAPWIMLDGDDRTGAVTTGENMSINLDQPGRFRRVLIFAMIYEGAPNWATVDGVVTLTPIAGPQIEVRLDATDQAARICAVAQLVNTGGELTIQREVQYINGAQSALDRAYGWGLNWTPGRK